MDISVIIVNYNTAHVVKHCIDSILKQIQVNYEILVVDNASQDNSLDVLKTYADKIILIASNINLGFGKANNLAFRQSQGRYVFLLNPDAAFLQTNDLYQMINYMQANHQYGLVGTRIVNQDQRIEEPPNFLYPKQHLLKYTTLKPGGKIAWVIGASVMLPRDVYLKVNGFDEDFFLYGEDADICFRIRQQGWEIGHNATVTVAHIGSASEVKTPRYEFHRKKQQALYLFFKKHYALADYYYLLRRERRLALMRLVILWPQVFVLKMSSSLIKYNKYQAIYDTAKETLFT